MVMATATYEECRKQRLEENKRRMQELNLHNLSDSLKKSIPPKTSPMKKVKARVTQEQLRSIAVRRSTRVADKPQPNYKEATFDLFDRSNRIYKRRDLLNRKYASEYDRMEAIQKAEDLDSRLDSEFPSFVKPMLQSHVTGGFWLGLPVQFSKAHLPDHDEAITLVDEDGNEWVTKYLAAKTGLSGGWRGFSLDHELVDGDSLVFQLIKPTVFKVYIIRVDSAEESKEDKADGNDKIEGPVEKKSTKTRSGDKADGNAKTEGPVEKKSTKTRSGDKADGNAKIAVPVEKKSTRTRSGGKADENAQIEVPVEKKSTRTRSGKR